VVAILYFLGQENESPISIDGIEGYARKWLMVYDVSFRYTKNTYIEGW